MRFLLFILVFLSTCSQKPRIINITYVKPAPNAPIILGNKKAFVQDAFKKQGIKVCYHDTISGYEQLKSIHKGTIDISSVSSGTTSLALLSRGFNGVIVGYLARAPKLFSMMTMNPEISLSNLKGKRIAAPKGTGLHQLLDAILKSQNLTWNDITYLPENLQKAKESLLDGSVDVALIAGVFATDAEKAGARLITNGQGFFDGAMIIVANKDFATKYPDLIKTYLDAQKESLKYLQEYPEESYHIIAEETGIPIDKVREMIPYYDFRQEITEEDLTNLTKLQDFLYEQEFITKTKPIENYIFQP
ncbi:MAG: ABC transporter substrate-binding protein [Brevinema sp.]